MKEALKGVVDIDPKDNLIRLVNAYKDLVFSIALKLTGDYFAAEDITQETFISAYKSYDNFDGGSEKAWLCRIAANRSIDYLRSLSRTNTISLDAAAEEACELKLAPTASVSGQDPLNAVMNKDIMERFGKLIDALPPPYNEDARAYFIDGYNAREISAHTGVSVNTVQTHLYRARHLLKKSIRKEGLI